ncbi:predicted protein [Postia placenta Mad-698-R]|nr:predicted protein [Postia placenta Mad-698-R]
MLAPSAIACLLPSRSSFSLTLYLSLAVFRVFRNTARNRRRRALRNLGVEITFAWTASATQDIHEPRLAAGHVASTPLYTAKQCGSFKLVAFGHHLPGGRVPHAAALLVIQRSFNCVWTHTGMQARAFKPVRFQLTRHVEIGHQTNAKTVPAECIGYFDFKVLFRQHTEVWEEAAKIFIKDVKSPNGTFINGERLSPEGVESEPFKLKSDDIEFGGIDIVVKDKKTIIHYKVAARVVCVFTEQEAQAAACAEAQAGPATYGVGMGGGAPPAVGAFSFTPGQPPNAPRQQRYPSLQQGRIGLGDRGGNMRAHGKSGLTFDHILSRLQGELQKSRDTGAELHSLTSAMNEIHDTLGGNLPPNLPPHPSNLPPVMPPQSQQQQQESEQQQAPAAPSPSDSDKIRSLETMLAEHEAIKREVGSLRELMEERKREMDTSRGRSGSPSGRRQYGHDDDSHYMSDDDDNVHIDEEDEEQLATEEKRSSRGSRGKSWVTRACQSQRERRTRSSSPPPAAAPAPIPAAVPDNISKRLTTLSKQLESALELSRSLEAQHSVAQSTISLLELKVTSLENLVHDTRSQVQVQTEATEQLAEAMCSKQPPDSAAQEAEQRTRESLTEMVNEWKKNVEGRWSNVQEKWTEEQEHLRRAKDEWETCIRVVKDGVGSNVSKVESMLGTLAALLAQQHSFLNGNGKLTHSGGLVTPPSPRSLSAESTHPRQRRKRSSSSRGRLRSRSASMAASMEVGSSASSISGDTTESYSLTWRRLPWTADDLSISNTELHAASDRATTAGEDELTGNLKGMLFPIIPESSVLNHPLSSSDDASGTATNSQMRLPPNDLVYRPVYFVEMR